jgi:hypothetical protein
MNAKECRVCYHIECQCLGNELRSQESHALSFVQHVDHSG